MRFNEGKVPLKMLQEVISRRFLIGIRINL